MEEKKCTYDEYYKLRNAIYFASNTELSIQLKYINPIDYYSKNPHEHVVDNLLKYRKDIANKYLNIQLNEEEKNILIDLFKKINKEIIDTLGLNY